jgi:hypothetical protein
MKCAITPHYLDFTRHEQLPCLTPPNYCPNASALTKRSAGVWRAFEALRITNASQVKSTVTLIAPSFTASDDGAIHGIRLLPVHHFLLYLH